MWRILTETSSLVSCSVGQTIFISVVWNFLEKDRIGLNWSLKRMVVKLLTSSLSEEMNLLKASIFCATQHVLKGTGIQSAIETRFVLSPLSLHHRMITRRGLAWKWKSRTFVINVKVKHFFSKQSCKKGFIHNHYWPNKTCDKVVIRG